MKIVEKVVYWSFIVPALLLCALGFSTMANAGSGGQKYLPLCAGHAYTIQGLKDLGYDEKYVSDDFEGWVKENEGSDKHAASSPIYTSMVRTMIKAAYASEDWQSGAVNACLVTMNGSDVSAGGFVRVASSQHLAAGSAADPAWKKDICIRKGMAADAIMRDVKNGMTLEQIMSQPKEPGISDKQVEWVRLTAHQALAWGKPWREFVDWKYRECIGS